MAGAVLHRAGKVTVREDTRHAGRYRITWVDDFGVQRERSGGRDLDAAIRIADAVSTGTVEVVQAAATVAALIEGWIATQTQVEDYTVQNQAALLRNHVSTEIGLLRCDQLSEAHVKGVMRKMEKSGYARETRKTAARLIRSVGRFGVRSGTWTTQRNPMAEVKLSRAKLDERDAATRVHPSDIPTRSQVWDLADQLDGLGHRLWADGVRVVDHTGIRFGELTALMVEHVDLGAGLLSIRQAIGRGRNGKPVLGPPKTVSGVRDIPLGLEVCEVFARLVEGAHPSGFLFGSAAGLVDISYAERCSAEGWLPCRRSSLPSSSVTWSRLLVGAS